jgi:hypothetical protein
MLQEVKFTKTSFFVQHVQIHYGVAFGGSGKLEFG